MTIMNNLLRLYDVEEILLNTNPLVLNKKYWGRQYPLNIFINALKYTNKRFKSELPLNLMNQQISLYINGTKINLNYLVYFTNLRIIDLSYNKIKKIENLESLINLECLILSNNKISKIENLESLTKLDKLFLQCNKINKIENLEFLTNLEYLYLDYNNIENIENLDKLTNLKYIFIRNNNINSSSLSHLENISTLKQVWMTTADGSPYVTHI